MNHITSGVWGVPDDKLWCKKNLETSKSLWRQSILNRNKNEFESSLTLLRFNKQLSTLVSFQLRWEISFLSLTVSSPCLLEWKQTNIASRVSQTLLGIKTFKFFSLSVCESHVCSHGKTECFYFISVKLLWKVSDKRAYRRHNVLWNSCTFMLYQVTREFMSNHTMMNSDEYIPQSVKRFIGFMIWSLSAFIFLFIC